MERVCFPGRITQADLPPYYQASNLYVSASHSDGSSVSLMEALASGLPALVSDIPGNREWITPGVSWLFRDGDDSALADGILEALRQREQMAEMGAAARRLAEQARQTLAGQLPDNAPRLYASRSIPAPQVRHQAARSYFLIQSNHAKTTPYRRHYSSPPRLHPAARKGPQGNCRSAHASPGWWSAPHAHTVQEVVVATLVEPGDDPVADACASRGYPCYRGLVLRMFWIAITRLPGIIRRMSLSASQPIARQLTRLRLIM